MSLGLKVALFLLAIVVVPLGGSGADRKICDIKPVDKLWEPGPA